MSSPAAPSPGAPSGAQSESAGQQQDIIPAPPQPEDRPSTQSRLAPIKTARVTIPGVMSEDDSDFFETPPPPKVKTKVARADGDIAPRGADGKFAKADGTPADTEVPEAPEAEGDAPKPSKFKFAGEEFDSEDAAAQNFKSLRGQFKPLQERANHAEIQLGKAAESARGWKAAHDALLAERGKPSPQADSAETSSPAEQGIDWGLYAEIKRVATEAGEPWKAEQWLQTKSEELIQSRIDAKLDEALKPSREREAQEALGAQTEELFGNLAEYVNTDGSPAFPELQDESSAYEVGKLWNSMSMPREYILTPQGAFAAVAMYRAIRGAQGRQAAAPEAIEAPSGPRAEQLAAQAANIVGGRADSKPLDESDQSDSAASVRIKQALRKTNLYRPSYGFEA